MFISEVGLRSGWAQAIWAVIYSALTLGAQFSFAAVPALRAWAAAQPHGVVTPWGNLAFTSLELLILLVSVAVTGAIEQRSFAD
jgi:hypothetical protein